MDFADALAELSAVSAPSGAEGELAALLEARWAPRCADVRRDALGNLLSRVGGTGPACSCRATWTRSAGSCAMSPRTASCCSTPPQGRRRVGRSGATWWGSRRGLGRDGRWLAG